MKSLVKILLLIASVVMINIGFAMPIVNYFWVLTGYAVVELIPRWVGREFYILLLIPISSVLLLISEILFSSKRQFMYLLLILLDLSFIFSLYEIVNITIHALSSSGHIILPGYYLMVTGVVLLNTILITFNRLSKGV
jgi:hypothetical protein